MVYRPRVNNELCFVLLPLHEPFLGYFEHIIKPAAKEARLEALQANDISGPTAVMPDIWNKIWEARAVVAILTERNPNVNYELGICHSLGVPAVLVAEKTEEVPFDYGHIRHILYNTRVAGWEQKLRDDLTRHLRNLPEVELLAWPYDTFGLSGTGEERKQFTLELEANRKEREWLLAEIKAKQDESKKLAYLIETGQKEYARVVREISDKQRQIEQIVGDIGGSREEREQLGTEVQEKKEERKQLTLESEAKRKEREGLLAEVKAKQEESKELARLAGAKQKDLERVTRDVDAKQRLIEQLASDVGGTRKERERLANEVAEQKEERKRLSSDLKAARQELERTKQEAKTRERQAPEGETESDRTKRLYGFIIFGLIIVALLVFLGIRHKYRMLGGTSRSSEIHTGGGGVPPNANPGAVNSKKVVDLPSNPRDVCSDPRRDVCSDPRVGETCKNPIDGQQYVWIPPGNFEMGCSQGDERCFPDEKLHHRVTLTRGFWIGQTEVTQGAYEQVRHVNPSRFKFPKDARKPVEDIGWQDAKDYCSDVRMRLPTEAEWEYAARAGNSAEGSDDLGKVAWHDEKSRATTHDVGGKAPNAWGLYDMLGNVWEWVSDWYGEYRAEQVENPQGPKTGSFRILRGGSNSSQPRTTRVSNRFKVLASLHNGVMGGRCVAEKLPTQEPAR